MTYLTVSIRIHHMTNLVCTAMAGTALVSALLVVVQAGRSPVNSVLWLITSFVAVACYLITCGMTFLGLSYVIVYVGAIAVLFLFVVMMLNLAGVTHAQGGLARNQMWPVALIIMVTGAVAVLPMGGHMTSLGDLPLGLLEGVHGLLYGVNTSRPLTAGDASLFSSVMDTEVSPMSQVQMLGMTLYTHGALWLMLIGILLMLAMLVPLALAFTG